MFRINNINKDIIYSNINSLKDTVIEFDNEFKLQNQKYYCSEFVVEQIGIKNLKIQKNMFQTFNIDYLSGEILLNITL